MSRRAIKLSGIITILRDGRGLIKHISDSVFISKYHLNGALDKDEVQYSIQRLRHVPFKRAKVLRVFSGARIHSLVEFIIRTKAYLLVYFHISQRK